MFVNPRGGARRGLTVLEQVKPIFASHGFSLDVRVTGFAGHATELARTIDLADYDGCCVIGGDGTVHEVANGLLQRPEPWAIPLGVIPAGTGNTVHHELQCSDPIQAAERIVSGHRRRIDVIRVAIPGGVVYCLNIIGWGAATDINALADRLRVFGPARYALAAMWHIARFRVRRVRLVVDGEESDEELLFVIGCNTRTTGSKMKLAPLAELDDGKLDLVILRRCSRLQMLRLFAKVYRGTHLSLAGIEYRQVQSFGVIDGGTEPLNLDGENRGCAPFCAETIPRALEIFA